MTNQDTPNNIQVTVYLPDEDAKKFLLFQKHYEVFSILLESKVFEQKAAAITLHFDVNGYMRAIERRDFLYDFKTSFDNTNSKVL